MSQPTRRSTTSRSASPARPSNLVPALVAALLVLGGTNADAAMRWGLSGFTGYQGYAMSDMNDVIANINDELSSPGDAVNLDELKGDVSFGAGLKFDLDPTWRAYAEYEHLSDNSGGVGYYDFGGDLEASGSYGGVPFSGSQSASGTTIGYHARADLDVTMSEKIHFDAALGYRSASGELEADDQGTGSDLDWSGIMTRVGFT